VRVKSRMHTNNGDNCVAAVLQDQGIILQPAFLVRDALLDGRLVELLPGYTTPEFGIHAVYASRKHMPLKLRKLIDFLAGSFRSSTWR
jgi:DNA-binding transcriptional LysR family regulator